MHRSFIPFLLASIGYSIVLLATSLPLFEWQINDVVADYPPVFEVQLSPYRVTTRLGEDLDVRLLRGKVYVSKDGNNCRYGDVNIVFKRSQSDEKLGQTSLFFTKEGITRLEM